MSEKDNYFINILIVFIQTNTAILSIYFYVGIEHNVEVNIEEDIWRRLQSQMRSPEMWTQTITHKHIIKSTTHNSHKRRKIGGQNIKYKKCKCCFQRIVSISEEQKSISKLSLQNIEHCHNAYSNGYFLRRSLSKLWFNANEVLPKIPGNSALK